MGQLKNNDNLEAAQIDAIIRYACAFQDSKVVEYARNVAGDAVTRRRVDNALQHYDDRWWYPTHWIIADPLKFCETMRTPTWLKYALLAVWAWLLFTLIVDVYIQLGVFGIITPRFGVAWNPTSSVPPGTILSQTIEPWSREGVCWSR